MARAWLMRVCAMTAVILTAAPALAQEPAATSHAEEGPAPKTMRVGRWRLRYASPAEVAQDTITLNKIVAQHDTQGRVWTLLADQARVRLSSQGAARRLDALDASGQIRLISPDGQVFMAARATLQPREGALALERADLLHDGARLSAARVTVTLARGTWRAERLGDARVVRAQAVKDAQEKTRPLDAPKRSGQE